MAKNQHLPLYGSTPEQGNDLRAAWRKIFNFDWRLGLLLMVCIPRFFLVLQANALGSYGYIGLIMVIAAILPFVFLTKHGRKSIGLTAPAKYTALLTAFFAG